MVDVRGRAEALLRAWKVAQNLLEYACGVAAATGAMVGAVKAVAPQVAALGTRLQAVGHAVAEKKIVIEAENLDDALAAIAAGAEVVQFGKARPEQLRAWCAEIRSRAPGVALLAAGGIRPQNAADYATSGVDALVTSSLYYAAPADVGVVVTPLRPES